MMCRAAIPRERVVTAVHHTQFFHRYAIPPRRRFTGIIILLCNHPAELYIQSVHFTSAASRQLFFHCIEKKVFKLRTLTFESLELSRGVGKRWNFSSVYLRFTGISFLSSFPMLSLARFFFLRLVGRQAGRTEGKKEICGIAETAEYSFHV